MAVMQFIPIRVYMGRSDKYGNGKQGERSYLE